MALVIVESFAKVPKLKKLLPKEYEVMASGGHIMDLDPNNMSIDLDTFKPTYMYYPKSKEIINKIKKGYKKHGKLIIASDLDREGEFIGESFRHLLNAKNYDRIVFNEITKKGITNAINNPVQLDYNKIKAQQTRRFMDRIFGYGVTPHLARIPGIENPKKLGCGRVQSGFVKLIVDRENKIKEFMQSNQGLTFEGHGVFQIGESTLKTYLINSLNKRTICDVNDFNLDMLLYKVGVSPRCTWKITNTKSKLINKSPKPPYTTATMQSDAANKLHWSVKKIMDVAQKLYEMGLITYMRTDATTLSEDALNSCEKIIKESYGEEYHNKTQYSIDQESAQEAHEAIRPCDFNTIVEIDTDQQKLYDLIWKRTVSSQMSKAVLESLQITITPYLVTEEPFGMVGNKSRYIFKGYTTVYSEEDIDEDIDENTIDTNSNVTFVSITVSEVVKSPPSRFTESQLVKAVTKTGIGRPGTTASFIAKIQEKDYVRVENIEGIPRTLIRFSSDSTAKINVEKFVINVGSENKRMVPTKIGYLVNNFLEEHFPQMMDLTFTAKLEKQLSNICAGKEDYIKVLTEFYNVLKPQIDNVTSKYNIQPYKSAESVIVGKYNTEDIYFIKTRNGFAIKTDVNNKAIWVNVKVKPTEEEARKLISNKLSKPVSEIVKTFGKKFTIRKSEKGAYIQVTKGKKVKFLPLKNLDPVKITRQQCEQLAENFLKT